jgi:alpha-maltose-1-phosphate synthase
VPRAGDGPGALFDWRTGFVPYEETASLFAEASVVVLPYRDASQSGVVPMAFANGRPVIVTDVGALTEVVRDGENGVVAAAVSPEAVAEAIVRAFSEPGLLARLAEGAVATITTGALSPPNIARLHLLTYREAARTAR